MIVAVLTIFIAGNQVRVYRSDRARAAKAIERQMLPAALRDRRALLEALTPVPLSNCTLERFGEAYDGGYLMCANLLGEARSGYSYGISGYDKWGCDISTKLGVKVHQYDCFDTRQPACPSGTMIFHAECVAGETGTWDGRFFDTIAGQLARNGDVEHRVAMKIDVEGAEWESLLSTPDFVLSNIDQLAVEFHRVADEDAKYLHVVERLKQFFYVAHLHFNNFSCTGRIPPLPGWAYEVLFVNKRIAQVDRSRAVAGLHPLAARNNPNAADCQTNQP